MTLSAPLLVFAGIVWLALLVESVAGFGATVITVALASQIYPLPQVLAAFVPVNFVLSLYIVARHRERVDVRVLVRRLLPATAMGVAVGIFLVSSEGTDWLRLAFAIFVLALSIGSLWMMRQGQPTAREPLSPWQSSAVLFIAGIVHGLFACGGPLLVYVAERLMPDKSMFRATVSAVWLVFHVVLLASYRAAGTLTFDSLKVSGVLMLALLLSIPVGEWIHTRLSAQKFRVGVYVLLAVAGAAQLIRALA
ncbi:MAG: sulfite exporter TauE/SafE family protein [Sandaracinaceae bacterium]|nr:sulfite exporter TauE/SafE family protein [Sandaracinaceae bacterium]